MSIYVYTSGTENTLKNAYLGADTLPSWYQEVEYIQSTGTQGINTWVNIKDWFTVKCNTVFDSWGGWMTLWWYLWYVWGADYRLYWWVQTAWKWCYWFMGSFSENLWTAQLNTKYNLELHIQSGNNYFKVGWTTLISWSQTFSTSASWTLWVLAGYSSDATWNRNYRKAKMYDYKVYDLSDNLIRDLIPCYRTADNVIWMYDKVNDVFYTNSWSWTFTKWPDVN